MPRSTLCWQRRARTGPLLREPPLLPLWWQGPGRRGGHPVNASSVFTRPKVVFVLACLCCLLWGSAYPAVKIGFTLLAIAQDDVATQLVFAGYRFVVAGTLLLVFLRLAGKDVLGMARGHVGPLIGLGVAQTGVQYVFFYVGLAHTTGVKASILGSVGAFAGVLLAHFIYHNDRLNWRKTAGCVLGFSGVLLVNLGGNAAGVSFDFSLLGEGFVVISALALLVASMYGKRVSQGMDAMVMTGYQLAFGGAALLLLGWALGGALSGWTLGSSLLLLYLATLSAVSFGLWGVLLKFNRVSQVSVYMFLTPVFGAGLSALFLGESIWAWKNLGALALVSWGIWWVTQEPTAMRKR